MSWNSGEYFFPMQHLNLLLIQTDSFFVAVEEVILIFIKQVTLNIDEVGPLAYYDLFAEHA